MNLARMPGPFGATVDSVDIGSLGETDAHRLVEALFEHKVLVIRGQQVGDAEYVRFGRLFGEPIVFFAAEQRDRRHPEVIRITNSPRTPDALRDGARHWHSDSSYEAEPAFVTMLYAREAPAIGNDTLFADTAAAYNALDAATKRRLADLRVVHDPRGGSVPLLPEETRGDSSSTTLPVVDHPLVMVHPVTRRPALFGFSGTASGIVGWPDDDASALLLELKQHVLDQRFRQIARADKASILMWDNYGVVHSATATKYSDADGEHRLLHRISTRGYPPALAKAPAERTG
jgi:alpha-ketoglutarate-dependent taurine dioxygenase